MAKHLFWEKRREHYVLGDFYAKTNKYLNGKPVNLSEVAMSKQLFLIYY